jgi:hypothetical protein
MLLHDSHDNSRHVIIDHHHIKQIFDCWARSVTHIWLHAVWECYANMHTHTDRPLLFLSLFFYVWAWVFCTFNWITILSYDISLILRTYLYFSIINVRFEGFTVVNLKSTIFWDVTPCSLVNAYLSSTFNFLPWNYLLLLWTQMCLLSLTSPIMLTDDINDLIFNWNDGQFTFSNYFLKCLMFLLYFARIH